MMNLEITKYVANWFARADEDLDIAQLILEEDKPYNPACFHAQQAAEKYLKGFLAHHEKHVRKIHDLNALLQECIKIDQSFEDLQKGTHYLSRFYVESRYPDDYIEFTREDAEKGLEAADRIKKFVLKKTGSKQKSGFGLVGIIIVIAAVAVLGGFFGYQYLKLQKIQEGAKAPVAKPPVTPSAQIQPQTAEIDTSNWRTYRNTDFGFEVKYPSDWVVTPFFLEKDDIKSFDGAIIHPSGATIDVREKFINVGGTFDIKGTKVRCELLEKPLFKCSEVNGVPIYTSSNNVSILRVFDTLVQSAVIIGGKDTIDTSTWKTYRNEKYGFEVTYDKDIFKEETSVESLPPEYDKKVNGIKLIHLISVQYCNAKGQCQPETKNMAIGFYPFAGDFKEVVRPIKDFFGVELKEVTIAGRKGVVIHTGVEGEGRYYYFLPSHWIGQTLLITRDYIDERVITSYKGLKEFMPLLKQEGAFDNLMKTLIFVQP